MSDLVFIPQLKPCFWRPLYYFYYVAYCGSYSKAALALHMSRPSLTRAIQSLEQRLHTALFLRSTRQVALTPEGLYVLGLAKYVLGSLRKIERLAETRALGPCESINLFIPEYLLADYLLEPLRTFGLKHPELRIRIYPPHALEQALPATHRIKIYLGFEEGSAWVQKPLWRFEGALYASRGYGLKEGILSEDLSEHRLLLLNATIPGIFEDMNWHVRLQAGSLFCQGSEDVVHTPEHLLKMAEADFGIIAWIKNHPALKAQKHRAGICCRSLCSKSHLAQAQAGLNVYKRPSEYKHDGAIRFWISRRI